ncbi:PH domain protein [Trichuris suis]|nr:PH domain protein [Trichuris suis]
MFLERWDMPLLFLSYSFVWEPPKRSIVGMLFTSCISKSTRSALPHWFLVSFLSAPELCTVLALTLFLYRRKIPLVDVYRLDMNCALAGITTLPHPDAKIVHQGWLMKRGEHIKNWRSRYFVLFSDGTLLGFRQRPEPGCYADPLNEFTVKDCQLREVDRPKPNTFIVRGLQWTTVIERTFNASSPAER